MQFVEVLGKLKASPKLIATYTRGGTNQVAVQRRIKELSAALDGVQTSVDKVWQLNADGKLSDDHIRPRLDKLAAERREIESSVAQAKESLAIARAQASRQSDVAALVRRAATIFKRANAGERREIARALTAELGGLVVDAHGKLHPAK